MGKMKDYTSSTTTWFCFSNKQLRWEKIFKLGDKIPRKVVKEIFSPHPKKEEVSQDATCTEHGRKGFFHKLIEVVLPPEENG